MSIEPNRQTRPQFTPEPDGRASVRPRWYHIPRWRWIPPGGYYGGFFAGVGLTMMISVLAMCHDILPSQDAIFGVGTAIFLINTLVCYLLEGVHDKKRDKTNG
jgi:hypothetical protein